MTPSVDSSLGRVAAQGKRERASRVCGRVFVLFLFINIDERV